MLTTIEPWTGRSDASCKSIDNAPSENMCTLFQILVTQFPVAKMIRVVQDNLNTLGFSAFYELLPTDQALAFTDCFEFFFLHKSTSRLKMIEFELSALSRLWLNRRIPILGRLEKEIPTLLTQCDAAHIKIQWQFSIQSARSKLHSHYVKYWLAIRNSKKHCLQSN